MTTPNFFLIGAAKAGTSSLHQYLRQHPDIYMPDKKEPNYFIFGEERPFLPDQYRDTPLYQQSLKLYRQVRNNSVVDWEAYVKLFDGTVTESAIGEASVQYLYFPETAMRLKAKFPNARLIAVLRNPVDRAFSSYRHLRRSGTETRCFRDALADEPIECEHPWLGRGSYYIRPGFYGKQLTRYFEQFPREQLKLFLYDDLVHDQESVLREIFGFLRVDPEFISQTTKRYNSDMESQRRRVQDLPARLLREILQVARGRDAYGRIRTADRKAVVAAMDEETRRWLIGLYRDDVNLLGELISRDLSHWLHIDQ